jgi:hypothetical protein
MASVDDHRPPPAASACRTRIVPARAESATLTLIHFVLGMTRGRATIISVL